MKYRRFGRTELRMPVFSCGGMRYQHSWSDVEDAAIPIQAQANLEATIEHALELGIHHIETARGYGSSERQLGRILPALRRDQLIVQTKVNPEPDADDFVRHFETSLSRLRLDYVDLFALHGLNNREKLGWALRRGGCLEAAYKLKDQGLVRHIGFSTHATTDVIVEAIDSGGFDYVNVHYYFVNPLNWPAVEAATRRDMGVFIISPNDKGGKLYEPPPRLVELCAPLTPMQFNDLFCLARPEVHTLSIGAARPSDLDEHVAALAAYDHIAETMAPIESRLRSEMETVLGRDWCEHWFEGIPEYAELPGQVNVREILRLFTFAKGLGLVQWGKMRYNLLGRADDWFPGENASSLDRDALASALSNSPLRGRVIEALEAAHALLLDAPKQRLSKS